MLRSPCPRGGPMPRRTRTLAAPCLVPAAVLLLVLTTLAAPLPAIAADDPAAPRRVYARHRLHERLRYPRGGALPRGGGRRGVHVHAVRGGRRAEGVPLLGRADRKSGG